MELTDTNVLIIAISLAIGVALTMLVIFPLLKKKDIKTERILGALITGFNGVHGLTEVLKSFIPQNAAIDKIQKIIDYAKIGVEKAEQLYHINKIIGNQRKEEAEKFVYQSLELIHIEVTPEIKLIVDACIEAAVLALGHSVKQDNRI